MDIEGHINSVVKYVEAHYDEHLTKESEPIVRKVLIKELLTLCFKANEIDREVLVDLFNNVK